MDLFPLLAGLAVIVAVIAIFAWSLRSLSRPGGKRNRNSLAKPPRPRHINPKTGDPFP